MKRKFHAFDFVVTLNLCTILLKQRLFFRRAWSLHPGGVTLPRVNFVWVGYKPGKPPKKYSEPTAATQKIHGIEQPSASLCAPNAAKYC